MYLSQNIYGMGYHTENNLIVLIHARLNCSCMNLSMRCGTRKRVQGSYIIDVSINRRGKKMGLAPIYFNKKFFRLNKT